MKRVELSSTQAVKQGCVDANRGTLHSKNTVTSRYEMVNKIQSYRFIEGGLEAFDEDFSPAIVNVGPTLAAARGTAARCDVLATLATQLGSALQRIGFAVIVGAGSTNSSLLQPLALESLLRMHTDSKPRHVSAFRTRCAHRDLRFLRARSAKGVLPTTD